MHTNFSQVIHALSAIGLEVNPSKSQITNINSINFYNDVSLIHSVLQDVSVTEQVDLSILEPHINPTGCRLRLDKAK